MKTKNKIIIAVATISILSLSFVGYRLLNRGQKQEVQYSLYSLKKSGDLSFSGKAVSEKTQIVTWDNMLGEIATINVVNGSQVNAGDILVTYTSKNNQNALAEKRAMQKNYSRTIANLNAELERQNTLFNQAKKNNDEAGKQAAESEQKSVNTSIAKYQEMLADVDAQIDTLENTTETVITAETSGTVVVDESAKKDSTRPVVTLNSNKIISEINVSEYDIEKIAVDQDVKINYMNQDKQITGKIKYKETAPLDPSSNTSTYPVQVELDEEVPLGYSLKVAVPQDEIKLPTSCILEEEATQYVFTYSKGKALKRKIKATKLTEDTYKLEEGLNEGEKVILNPKGVKDQMDVRDS